MKLSGSWPTRADSGGLRQTMTDQATTGILHRTVVLVGMMGCGKTAIGRALSTRLQVPFLDSDAEIERAAQATIPEIFQRDGEPFFRKREAEVIARLLSGVPAILSTGGGAYLAERNRAEIAAHGVALWLDAPLPLLWERVRHKDTRPLLRTVDPLATLTEIFHERTPIYQKAGLRVAVQTGASIEDTTDAVVATLIAAGNILEPTK